jgi:hypothetical protein
MFLFVSVLFSAYTFPEDGVVGKKEAYKVESTDQPEVSKIDPVQEQVTEEKSIKKQLKETEAYKNASLKEKLVMKKAAKQVEKLQADPGKVSQLKELADKAATTAGDNQIVALILVIVAGVLGIHRFYLGYTWQGIVQLLTLGGCGIWALIDLIRIATGSLKPKGGSYKKTL